MSKENLDQFIQQISDSEELQARIGDEMHADTFIGLGAEHGCKFSAEDLVGNAELSDEELDGVAGGVLLQAGTSIKGKISLNLQEACANGTFLKNKVWIRDVDISTKTPPPAFTG